jgi:Icc protein
MNCTVFYSLWDVISLLIIKTTNIMESEKHIQKDENNDGIDRAGFLKCMAWAGTGVLWMMSGGIMKSFGMSQMIDRSTGGLKKGLIIPKSDFSFVQISDSHIGFNKAAN